MVARGRKCVFLGYPAHIKGYLLLDFDTKVVLISRDIQFYELVFPFKEKNQEFNYSRFAPAFPNPPGLSTERFIDESQGDTEVQALDDGTNGNIEIPANTQNVETNLQFNPEGLTVDLKTQDDQQLQDIQYEAPRRSTRHRSAPLRYQDCYCGLFSSQNDMKSAHSLHKVICYDSLSDDHQAFISSLYHPLPSMSHMKKLSITSAG